MKLSNMATVLRRYGLTVVEHPGWSTRGYAGQDLTEVRGVLWHHTATNRAAFANHTHPTAALCINGRSDLPGPLCQILFARDGAVHLLAAGVCNHAGYGLAAGIPQDMGNHYMIGIEMESSGVAPWDWTADQLRVAPYLGAALELGYLGHLPAASRIQIGHMEYSSARVPDLQGKIDPAGWPGGMAGLRATINAKITELSKGTKAPPVTAPAKVPAAATPATNAKPNPNGPHWVVSPGDTLAEISRYYGGPSVAQIKAYNGLRSDAIRPGQKIYIPGPLVWHVEAGDTLGEIGAYYGIPWQTIAANNGIKGTTIHVGQTIKIWS